MTESVHDFVVIGGGIAGVSAAYELAGAGSVLLLEGETQLGYHATGRSAAMLTENYGNEAIRLLTIASREFFASPPEVFGDTGLLHSRGMLWIARDDQRPQLAAALEFGRRFVPSIRPLEPREALELCPALAPAQVAAAMLEPDAMDLDVHAIHQGYLRGLRRRGGAVQAGCTARALHRDGERWRVDTQAGSIGAGVVVNAAGAWADEVAALAGVRTIGLVPKRRTGILFDAPANMPIAHWPCVIDADERFYFKPESGRLMGSPADETPSPPCDAQAEELDVAETVERIERATTLRIRRLGHRWAGLRSFVADGSPVAGYDAEVPGFFWLAGQGGYGVMTSPALARAAAGLALEGRLPQDLSVRGLSAASLSPQRLARGARGPAS